MGLYSRALHHVNNKDFRRTHQHRLTEQEILSKKENKIKELEEKVVENLNVNWRKELEEISRNPLTPPASSAIINRS
jgi:hypothetical protein